MKGIAQITKQVVSKVIPQGERSNRSLILSRSSEEILKHYPNGEAFVTQFNYDFCQTKYIAYKSVKEALCSGKIKLFDLAKAYGEEIMLAWLQSWLINLSGYMDFSINQSQAKSTSIFILEECYMFNIVELTLFFKKLAKGDYGQFYGKFNGQIIMSALRDYRQTRGNLLQKMSSEEQEIIQKS